MNVKKNQLSKTELEVINTNYIQRLLKKWLYPVLMINVIFVMIILILILLDTRILKNN